MFKRIRSKYKDYIFITNIHKECWSYLEIIYKFFQATRLVVLKP